MNTCVAGGAQHKAKRKVPLDPYVAKLRSLGQLEQFIRFEASQYRQRAIVPKQSIMQNQFPNGRVKKISNRMPVQIDHEDPSLCNAAHLAQNSYHLPVNKVMRK